MLGVCENALFFASSRGHVHDIAQTIVVEAAGYVGGRVKTHELLTEYPIELGTVFGHLLLHTQS